MRSQTTEERRFAQVALKYAPKGIKIRWKRGPKLIPAHASLAHGEMLVPRPRTREALFVYLHECGHFALKHFMRKDATCDEHCLLYTGNGFLTRAHEEFEAEQWAIAIMRLEGIKVPRSMIKEAKEYVRWCLTMKPRPPHFKNAKTPPQVRKFGEKT